MKAIIDGCSSKSDVIAKKARFYADLKSRGIHRAEPGLEEAEPEFNVESIELLENVRQEFSEKRREFQEEKCIGTLRMFSKINSQRKGNSRKPFEDIGSILVSGSYMASFLAFHNSIRGDSGGIPFATDLEFITNRLWFKLHKSLAKGFAHPQSLSVLAKAQVVLSSQLNNSVSEKFNRIKSDYDDGKISEEETKILFNELRSFSTPPEELGATNVESALAFLDHRDYEHYLRERSLLEKEARAGREAVNELNAIREAQHVRRKKLVAFLSIVAHSVLLLLIFVGVGGALVFGFSLLTKVASGTLTVISILVTLAIGVLSWARYRAIRSWIVKSHTKMVSRFCTPRT